MPFDDLFEQPCFQYLRKKIQKFNLTSKMGPLLLILLTAGTFLLVGTAVAGQSYPPEESTGLYKFGAGDVLDVLVFGEPEMSRTVFVRSDGRISLPLAGEFVAAGKTPQALAKQITEKLKKVIESPNVTVILSESSSKIYYVLGQVASPGQYTLTRPVTVLQAIARAGGFSEWAKKSRIMIVGGPKNPQKTIYFDYDDFLKGDNSEQNIVIKPEDTIVVP